jgi:cell division protein FtsN
MTEKDNKRSLLNSRSRFRRSRQGRGLPRVMWVAIAVCVIGAVLIFRDQGSRVPTGIGEYQTVVTAPDQETTPQDENTPRSGDVDINDQTDTLTPEKPTGENQDPAVSKPPVKEPTTKQTTTKQTTTKQTTTKPTPPPPLIKPSASGPYLVQTGSFGNIENAEKEANRLKNLGFDARIKTGNTSDNSLIFRVKIGYFKSRKEAEAFIRQNRKKMPGAIPTHR